MQISQKLFNQQAINNFAKLDAEIQKIQEQVSTGKNILSASDDPVNAVSLSVANEQKELLQRLQWTSLCLSTGALQMEHTCGFSSGAGSRWTSAPSPN